MRILLIDDDQLSLACLEDALEMVDYYCESYSDPAMAIKAFKKHDFDIIISDICMPELNGVDVFKEIYESDPSAKIILMTGFDYLHAAISNISNYTYAFLKKPLDYDQLLKILEKANTSIAEEKNG